MSDFSDRVFARVAGARYVAVYAGGRLEMTARPDLQNASGEESDRYEELLVNPTMIKLLTQRGEIDCGGFRYVVVRYGNFYQFVMPVEGGHVSVALETGTDLPAAIEVLRQLGW